MEFVIKSLIPATNLKVRFELVFVVNYKHQKRKDILRFER
jgi:hypothetical protein